MTSTQNDFFSLLRPSKLQDISCSITEHVWVFGSAAVPTVVLHSHILRFVDLKRAAFFLSLPEQIPLKSLKRNHVVVMSRATGQWRWMIHFHPH